MYNYEWDIETGGYILLPSKITGVTKEVRPVFSEELRFLGLDRDYGWDFPDCEGPLMWAEARRYFYKGELVCEASGGGLYEMPTLKNVIKDLRITPVDIEMMLSKNESVMDGLVQKTLWYSSHHSSANSLSLNQRLTANDQRLLKKFIGCISSTTPLMRCLEIFLALRI